MSARIRRLAAGWLLTVTLTLSAPAPALVSRVGPLPGFSSPTSRHERERLATSEDREGRPVRDGVDPARWSGVQLSLRVSYEQSELLSRDEAQG